MKDEVTIGYCLKCKKKVEIEEPKEVLAKNKRRMVKGICPVCKTVVCKFLGK